MSKAKEVLDQIKKHYTNKGIYHVNHQDLQNKLQYNKIDREKYSMHNHIGFETSFDNSMSIIFYSDNSALVINSNGSMHAIGN